MKNRRLEMSENERGEKRMPALNYQRSSQQNRSQDASDSYRSTGILWLVTASLLLVVSLLVPASLSAQDAKQSDKAAAKDESAKEETQEEAAEEELKIWEYDPYQVRVWLALDRSAVMPIGYADTIAQRIEFSAEQVDLSGWKVEATAAPHPWRQLTLDSIDEMVLPEDADEVTELLQGDKLIFVSVKHDGMQYHLEAREVDCRTKVWGPIIRESTYHRDRVPEVAYQVVAKAFVPMVRIEDINTDRGTAVAKMRAGGFHVAADFGTDDGERPSSPVWISDDDVLMPMIKVSSRRGKSTGDKIKIAEWTFLTITSRDGVLLHCQIHSAMRAPLGGRSSRRVEKLGMVVRPQATTTRICLESRDRPPIRLPGYEVFRKLPGSEETELLGKTDWQGAIEVTRDDANKLQIFYARSGSRVLARLPVVVGLYPEVVAPMYNDNVRRRAEGIMRGLETEFTIVVAKRELLASRIEMQLAKRDLEEAERLYTELRSLPTMDDFQAKLDSQERTLNTDDRREGEKIAKMFNQLRKLVTQHLSRDVTVPIRERIDEEVAKIEAGTASGGDEEGPDSE